MPNLKTGPTVYIDGGRVDLITLNESRGNTLPGFTLHVAGWYSNNSPLQITLDYDDRYMTFDGTAMEYRSDWNDSRGVTVIHQIGPATVEDKMARRIYEGSTKINFVPCNPKWDPGDIIRGANDSLTRGDNEMSNESVQAKTDQKANRTYLASLVHSDLESDPDVIGAILLDSEDAEHTGPYGGVQQRVLVAMDNGQAALVVVYSDHNINELLEEEMGKRREAAARLKATREFFSDGGGIPDEPF